MVDKGARFVERGARFVERGARLVERGARFVDNGARLVLMASDLEKPSEAVLATFAFLVVLRVLIKLFFSIDMAGYLLKNFLFRPADAEP